MAPSDRRRPSSFSRARSPAGGKAFEFLARTQALALGDYRCAHTHVERGAEEATLGHVINFPRYGVYVKHVRGREVLVDARRAVFFNGGEPFRTSHPHGCGDGGRFLRLRADVVLDLLREIEPRALGHAESPFARTDVPLETSVELFAATLFTRAGQLDPLELEESTLALAAAILRCAASSSGSAPPANGAGVADGARGILARRFREPLRLEEFARALGVSMFHLCRVFKARTGATVHEHLTRLRLGAALHPLAGGREDLTELALELGFSSHSHFTRAFRRAFGLTPSEVRLRASGRRLVELRSRLQRAAPPA